MELEGKVAVVTGGAAGIGKAIVTALAAKGAVIAIADIDQSLAMETSQELEAVGNTAGVFVCDVSDSAQVERLFQGVVGSYGRVDILVNDAGVGHNSGVLEITEAEWDRIMSVNLKGAFLCSRAAARAMIDQGHGGRIISIASTAGDNARVNSAAYSASKAGLLQFTRVLAMELGPYAVTVNAVAPGLTMTDSPVWNPPSEAYQKAFIEQTALGRTGTPQDIAEAVAFLASPQAGYITGQALFVDGGYSAGKLSVRG